MLHNCNIAKLHDFIKLFHFLQSSEVPRKRHSVPEDATEEDLIRIANDVFITELGLTGDDEGIDLKLEIREVSAGTYLMKEDSNKVK